MGYSPTLGRWLETDPVGYVDGMHRYQYERSSPVVGRDPFGLYDEAGHYYTTYIAALLAGMSAAQAEELAYWSQYPDMPRPANEGGGPGDYDAIGSFRKGLDWAVGIQDYLHSLQGGDPEKRRRLLSCLLKQEGLEPWERGLLIHALGDASAHTWNFLGEHGFPPPFGHLIGGHAPDHIGNNPGAYQNYVNNLFGLLGGQNNPLLYNFLANAPSRPALTFLDDGGVSSDEIQALKDWAQTYLHADIPAPRLDPNRRLTIAQVDRLLDRIEKAVRNGCCE
jgi:hypothetical protein